MRFMSGHVPKCTCRSCDAASYLKERLTPADFEEFLAKVEASPYYASHGYDEMNPAPDDASVDILETTVRGHDLLRALNISTIGALVQKSPGDLLYAGQGKNFGQNTLRKLEKDLANIGRKLRT